MNYKTIENDLQESIALEGRDENILLKITTRFNQRTCAPSRVNFSECINCNIVVMGDSSNIVFKNLKQSKLKILESTTKCVYFEKSKLNLVTIQSGVDDIGIFNCTGVPNLLGPITKLYISEIKDKECIEFYNNVIVDRITIFGNIYEITNPFVTKLHIHEANALLPINIKCNRLLLIYLFKCNLIGRDFSHLQLQELEIFSSTWKGDLVIPRVLKNICLRCNAIQELVIRGNKNLNQLTINGHSKITEIYIDNFNLISNVLIENCKRFACLPILDDSHYFGNIERLFNSNSNTSNQKIEVTMCDLYYPNNTKLTNDTTIYDYRKECLRQIKRMKIKSARK